MIDDPDTLYGSVNYSVYSSEMILFMSVLLGSQTGRYFIQHNMDLIFT